MNDFEAYFREVWSPKFQAKLQTKLIAKAICDFVVMPDGSKFHQPYHTDLVTSAYTKNATSGAVTATAINTHDEFLTTDTIRVTSFFIDKFDDIKMFYKNLKGELLDEATYRIGKDIDSAIFAEYANAGLSVDAGDVGGVDGQAITLSLTDGATGNIMDVIQKAKSKLAGNDVPMDGGLFAVVDSNYYYTVLERYLQTHGWKIQDATLENGYIGNVSGLEMFISNNLATSTVSGQTAKHWLIGKKGAISLGVQADAVVAQVQQPMNADGTHRIGDQYDVASMYGKKTFYWNAKKLVDIAIKA